MSGLSHRAQGQKIYPFATNAQVVAGTTVLLAYTYLGDYEDLLFTVLNVGAGALTLQLDTSQDLSTADDAYTQTRTVAAGAAGSFLVQAPEPQLRRSFKLSTVGASSVKWEVRGRPRM